MKARGIKIVFLGIAALAAISAIVMLLWNFLMPGIFGLTTISFWQALGLFALARILFGGFGRKMPMGMHHHSENPIHKKWRKMTPEQRMEFINRRKRFGFGGHGHHGWDRFDMEEQENPGKENE